jgi:hypothetical protein
MAWAILLFFDMVHGAVAWRKDSCARHGLRLPGIHPVAGWCPKDPGSCLFTRKDQE